MEKQSAFLHPLNLSGAEAKPVSFRSVLSLIREAVSILGPGAEILYINDKAKDIFQRLFNKHGREGLNLLELLPESRHEIVSAMLRRCWQGECIDYDTEVLRDGHSFWVNCRYTPLYDEGIIRCIAVTVEDIKARKELEAAERKRQVAERELDQARLLFQHFVEHAPLRAWITDAEGYIHFMNHQYEQAFEPDLRNRDRNIFNLFPKEWADEYLQEIRKVLALNRPCETVSKGRKPDGTTGLFRVTRFPLPVGNRIMVAGWAVEITEQVQLQKKLLQEARNKKRQIIRSIIETQEKERRELSVELHDNVNQILSSCQLMLEVARDKQELARSLTDKAYDSLKTAITEIRKISHELNPSAIEDIGLPEAINEMVETINSSGKLKIFFTFREYGENIHIGMTDRIAVYRIVQEQLNNIIKHAHASTVHISLYYKFSRIYLHIEDDGIGFDMNQIKKGLGLRNIQHRVAYYQGKLKIDSAHGRGCKLKVLLLLPTA